MTYSDFTVLLARQRSGTNPLRSALGTNPDIFCFNEVFNWGDRNAENEFLRDTNFFNFLERYAEGDVRRIFPDRHEEIFRNFLEYLRCFSDKPAFVIDVKYNTSHFLTEPWARDTRSPFLFDLIAKYELRVLNITRRNYLRSILSTVKARRSNRYTVDATDLDYRDEPTSLDPDWVLREARRWAAEDEQIRERFATYGRFRSYDYTDVFPSDRKPISVTFLSDFAEWLGIANRFTTTSEFRRQSFLPLEETIENYDEIADALRGTEFDYCLEDEPAYRTSRRRRRKVRA